MSIPSDGLFSQGGDVGKPKIREDISVALDLK